MKATNVAAALLILLRTAFAISVDARHSIIEKRKDDSTGPITPKVLIIGMVSANMTS